MMTVPAFRSRKGSGTPLVVLTAYDAMTTAAAEAAGVDALLVGDSLGMVELGYASTLPVTMDDMLHHAKAVGRLRRNALLIADMPWMSFHTGPRDAVVNASRFVREAGADAVKIEGGRKRLDVLRAFPTRKFPSWGISASRRSRCWPWVGTRSRGALAKRPTSVDDAKALAEGGAFAIVLEGIPSELAGRVTAAVDVPTIGIGAGAGCDGQVLVIHDLLGMLPGSVPKFVRRYADVHGVATESIRKWAADVRSGAFPSSDETYG